jgi:hypothetical protein
MTLRKKILILFLSLVSVNVRTNGQDICNINYGTGQWNSQGLGNHRAVIYVEKAADAVRVIVPWRRLDNVEDKALILIDAFTDQRVNNVYSTALNKDYGELVFEPVSGEGNYYLYYMPGKVNDSRMWWFPYPEYEKPSDTFDINWKKRTTDNIVTGIARTIRFESKNDFHCFYPMEVPVTRQELSEIMEKNRDKEFFVFPEDRKYPIRMYESIPYRWFKKGTNYTFEGNALKNESYAWQLGIFAPFKELNGVKITFSDLRADDGSSIPSDAFKCINSGGRDHLGNSFTKIVNVPYGEVQAFWIVTDIKEDQPAGTYKGKVIVSAEGTKRYAIAVVLKVNEGIAENKGYNIPQNQSRLNWLDSGIGLDNELFRPFIPVNLEKNTISILGRKLTFNKLGFPAKITSSFSASNHETNAPDQDIISEDIRLDVLQGGKSIDWKVKAPIITLKTDGAVAWESVLTSDDVYVYVRAKMECDGYVNYETIIAAEKNIKLDDVKLIIPYKKTSATYLMGMGRQGGKTPDDLNLDWKWDVNRTNNMVWIGSVNAGMQVKLKHLKPDWAMMDLKRTGPYRDWSNEGKGGCNIRSVDNEVVLTAFTGNKTLMAGDTMVLNFGLAITPFKILDDRHWEQRYYHDSNSDEASIKDVITNNKAKVMILHQGNIYNPFINYPFLTPDLLKGVISFAKDHGITTKLYYTVRELSVYLPELWALRSLGDEVFTRENVIKMPDFSIKENIDLDFNAMGTMGHPWLYEHLRSRYDGRWHNPLPAGTGADWDISIRTQTLSRWLNYYAEGFNWLIRNLGVGGLYLDGIGYDREFMKRLRKIMDRAAEGGLFDFHAGNTFNKYFGMNSPTNQYMELFPYINSLWFGEGFDYNLNPDYWLIEISGIPFGLYGEMLADCGNTYRGMVYGMSSRLAWQRCNPSNIWKLWDFFGMSGSKYTGYWDPDNSVKTNNIEVLASTFIKTDRVMIAMGNWSDKPQTVRLDIDWHKLKINPSTVKIEIPDIDGLQSSAEVDLKNLIIPASKGLIIIIKE